MSGGGNTIFRYFLLVSSQVIVVVVFIKSYGVCYSMFFDVQLLTARVHINMTHFALHLNISVHIGNSSCHPIESDSLVKEIYCGNVDQKLFERV